MMGKDRLLSASVSVLFFCPSTDADCEHCMTVGEGDFAMYSDPKDERTGGRGERGEDALLSLSDDVVRAVSTGVSVAKSALCSCVLKGCAADESGRWNLFLCSSFSPSVCVESDDFGGVGCVF